MRNLVIFGDTAFSERILAYIKHESVDDVVAFTQEESFISRSYIQGIEVLSFENLNERLKATILMVTHDAFTASYTHRILFIKDGKIFNELIRGNDSRKEFFDRIIEVIKILGGDSNSVF